MPIVSQLTDRHGIQRLPSHGPLFDGDLGALTELDHLVRKATKCPHCGLPRRGAQKVTGGRMSGTGRFGCTDYRAARVQTRAEAGLCCCWEWGYEENGKQTWMRTGTREECYAEAIATAREQARLAAAAAQPGEAAHFLAVLNELVARLQSDSEQGGAGSLVRLLGADNGLTIIVRPAYVGDRERAYQEVHHAVSAR